MFCCRNLKTSGLILAVEDGFPEPHICYGGLGFEYYEICLKDDIVMQPLSTSIQKTGIVMKVPEDCIAVVDTPYKPNACMVEEAIYGPKHGKFTLELKCENPTEEKVFVFGSYQIAHLYLFEIRDENKKKETLV